MEVKLDKRYELAVGTAQAWQVLCDIHAVARCMPGAQITEQLDATHYKGTVKSKVGPAVMQFGGDIEVLGLDAATLSMQMLGKGADKSGSSASMDLKAHLEAGATAGTSVLVGVATIIVSGKLAQFGSRLLVPVSDAMLAQFADNFRAAAAAVPAPEPVAVEGTTPAAAEPSAPRAAVAVTPAPVKELNALALMWTVFKDWLAGLFGKRA
jgi:carbon monoxide dehydrogenase subunit G